MTRRPSPSIGRPMVYLNRTTGEEVGKKPCRAIYGAVCGSAGLDQMEVDVESNSVRLAERRRRTRRRHVLAQTQKPEVTEYFAVNVKRDGKWLLDRLTDKTKEVIPTPTNNFKPLESMVGSWINESEDADVELESAGRANKNFLTRAV